MSRYTREMDGWMGPGPFYSRSLGIFWGSMWCIVEVLIPH